MVYERGAKIWRNEKGQPHREDGPAVVRKDGAKHWYLNGKLHREDGPAVEYPDGTKEWWVNGKPHREDGPAFVFPNGFKEWQFKGVCVGIGDAPDPVIWERVTSIEANGGPLLNGCILTYNTVKIWYKDDIIHRDDGPAIERVNGNDEWFYQGKSLGLKGVGFWKLWELLTEEKRNNPNLLKWIP